MRAAEAIKLLESFRDEAATLPPSINSAEFQSWQGRTRSVLVRSLGENHHLTETLTRSSGDPRKSGVCRLQRANMASFFAKPAGTESSCFQSSGD